MDSEISNYSVTGRIGEGAHGLVFRAMHIQSGREVALKKILIKNLEDGIPVNVMREIKALQLLRCKYVSIFWRLVKNSTGPERVTWRCCTEDNLII